MDDCIQELMLIRKYVQYIIAVEPSYLEINLNTETKSLD